MGITTIDKTDNKRYPITPPYIKTPPQTQHIKMILDMMSEVDTHLLYEYLVRLGAAGDK